MTACIDSVATSEEHDALIKEEMGAGQAKAAFPAVTTYNLASNNDLTLLASSALLFSSSAPSSGNSPSQVAAGALQSKPVITIPKPVTTATLAAPSASVPFSQNAASSQPSTSTQPQVLTLLKNQTFLTQLPKVSRQSLSHFRPPHLYESLIIFLSLYSKAQNGTKHHSSQAGRLTKHE